MIPLLEKLPENFLMLIKSDRVNQKLNQFEYFLVNLGFSWKFNGVSVQNLFSIKSVRRYLPG